MKIALATNDGQTVSVHFGQSQYFMVVMVEDGQVIGKELRDRSLPYQPGPQERPAVQLTAGDSPKHNTDHLGDCKVVMARGMGAGMFWFLQNNRFRVILTEIANIDRAVEEYLAGRLQNHPEFVQ